ncbi:MAG: precorrin-3B C(17)-methyltransferase [Alphaproteobacteria bacterium]|nr:precorrin-3B C(17)-methyltransferase [Alphaproteobacteria bacterium]
MTTRPADDGADEKAAAVIIVLGPSGLSIAERLKAALGNAEIQGASARLSATEVDRRFDDLGPHLQSLYKAKRPLLILAASAIPIRLLAPVLEDKTEEPPVLAIAEDGSAVVPLLGGHRGANDLARRVGEVLGTSPAITTAGDLRLGLALDQPPPGWRIRNLDQVKPITAALLAGEPVRLDVRTPIHGDAWLETLRRHSKEDGKRQILITDRSSPPPPGGLVYHPATLALGVGCERDAEPAELIDLAEQALDQHGLAKASIAAMVSIALKAAEPAVHALADHLGVPARFFDAETLERQTPRLANPSGLVFKETGCHGVAEGAALAAIGDQGALIVEKTKSKRATLAIGRAAEVIGADRIGRPQGHLAIIGIGPGSSGWRTPEADRFLADSDHWIGYRGYLDLLHKPAHVEAEGFALGEEEDRARRALDLAAGGADVALVSSGDAGIYAMASLVYELLDRAENPAWQRIEVTMTPGISALQAAAARAGAPLGHDFCAISLSDLLTPWSVIEQRVRAAAEGDFVIALYNPASQKRRQGLARTMAVLEDARPPSTPVIIARNLGRDGESVEVVALENFEQDRIDMMSLVIIGSSQTRMAPRLHGRPFIYTPRGYLGTERSHAERRRA